jgi:hypothetical protein
MGSLCSSRVEPCITECLKERVRLVTLVCLGLKGKTLIVVLFLSTACHKAQFLDTVCNRGITFSNLSVDDVL